MGHRELGGRDLSPLCEELTRAAVLEEASIRAFCQLAVFLRRQGASDRWFRRCLSAALDEVDHARATRSLVHALGGSCPRPTVESVGSPSLFAVARHNAVEGCVHETWAALEAHLSANNAADPSLQRFFARIARDETRHAQLARDLHDWFMTRLTRVEQAEVCRELRAALRTLPEQATRRAAQRPRVLGGPDIALARAAALRLSVELSP